MEMTQLRMGSFTASTDADKGLIGFYLGESDMTMSFSWKYEEQGFPFIKDHGTGRASVSGLSGSMSTTVGVDPECGQAQFYFEAFSFDIGKIVIDLDGGASALYDLVLNTFISLMEDLFADELSDMLGESIEAAINDGLASAGTETDMAYDLGFDTRPVPPGMSVMDSYIGIRNTGYMFPRSVGNGWEARTKPAPLPDIVNNADVQIICSNNVWNTGFSAANYNGVLGGVISPETVSSSMYDSYLTTSVLASICPEVYDAFPSSSISLSLSASIDPTLTFMPSAGFLNITGTVDVSVNSDPASDVYDTEVFEL
ncbi:hypothetical protein KIPB_012519, partial [Kipferlia bialata]|eukprot:g12519.t1